MVIRTTVLSSTSGIVPFIRSWRSGILTTCFVGIVIRISHVAPRTLLLLIPRRSCRILGCTIWIVVVRIVSVVSSPRFLGWRVEIVAESSTIIRCIGIDLTNSLPLVAL